MTTSLLCLSAMGCSGPDDLTTSMTTEAAIVGTETTDKIRIGLEGPLAGAHGHFGTGMLNGARMAPDELNAAGSIDGRMIAMVGIDDRADSDAGISAANEAIAAGLSGVVATTAIPQWAGASSVALIYDETADYTVNAKTALSNAIAAAGVRVTAEVAITPGADSYADAVAEATAGGVDLVYVIAYYPESGLIARAILEPAPVVVLSTQDDGTLHLDEAWSAVTGIEF